MNQCEICYRDKMSEYISNTKEPTCSYSIPLTGKTVIAHTSCYVGMLGLYNKATTNKN